MALQSAKYAPWNLLVKKGRRDNLFKKTDLILSEVFDERNNQEYKWGQQNHSPSNWCMILGEEVGEVNKAALEYHFGEKWGYKKKPHGILMEYRSELIQVCSGSDCHDRKFGEK